MTIKLNILNYTFYIEKHDSTNYMLMKVDFTISDFIEFYY